MTDSARRWVRITQIFPDYRNHFPRLLDMAYHLGFARSAAGAEHLAQGTDGRGPIRRFAALAGSLPVQRSFPDFPDFPVQKRGEPMHNDGGVASLACRRWWRCRVTLIGVPNVPVARPLGWSRG